MIRFGISFIFFVLISFTNNLVANENNSKSYFGVDGGYAFVDLKAEETAQTLANLSGSTVSYQEDQAAGYLRFYYGFAVSENLDLQAGYFNTSSITATYTIGANSASESYEASGFDASFKFRPDVQAGFYAKLGVHYSELTGNATITIGGTTYDIASAKANGSGLMYGLGYDFGQNIDGSGWKVGYDIYNTIGGISGADFGLMYLGYNF